MGMHVAPASIVNAGRRVQVIAAHETQWREALAVHRLTDSLHHHIAYLPHMKSNAKCEEIANDSLAPEVPRKVNTKSELCCPGGKTRARVWNMEPAQSSLSLAGELEAGATAGAPCFRALQWHPSAPDQLITIGESRLRKWAIRGSSIDVSLLTCHVGIRTHQPIRVSTGLKRLMRLVYQGECGVAECACLASRAAHPLALVTSQYKMGHHTTVDMWCWSTANAITDVLVSETLSRTIKSH